MMRDIPLDIRSHNSPFTTHGSNAADLDPANASAVHPNLSSDLSRRRAHFKSWSSNPRVHSCKADFNSTESLVDLTGGSSEEFRSGRTGATDGLLETVNADDIFKKYLESYKFTPYKLVMLVFSALAYIADIVTDSYLVYKYYRQGDYWWFRLTLMFIIVPALTTTAYSLYLYFKDYNDNKLLPSPNYVWTLRLVFHGLLLAPLVRIADTIYIGITSRRTGLSLSEVVKSTRKTWDELLDYSFIRLIECFMESAPQFLLQLYILFTQETLESKFPVWVQPFCCLFSWYSLTSALTEYPVHLRLSNVEEDTVTISGRLVLLFSKGGLVASRILSLALLATMASIMWFWVALFVHWFLAVVFLITHGTTYWSKQAGACREYPINMILGAIYCFDIINVHKGHARLYYLLYYSVVGLENFLIASFWYSHFSEYDWSARRPQLSLWLEITPVWLLPSIAVSTFLFGLAMMLNYYAFYHPSNYIKICISCDDLLKESYICTSAEPVDSEEIPDGRVQRSDCITDLSS